jgi:abortive infection bacteriophage resistance protein
MDAERCLRLTLLNMLEKVEIASRELLKMLFELHFADISCFCCAHNTTATQNHKNLFRSKAIFGEKSQFIEALRDCA